MKCVACGAEMIRHDEGRGYYHFDCPMCENNCHQGLAHNPKTSSAIYLAAFNFGGLHLKVQKERED